MLLTHYKPYKTRGEFQRGMDFLSSLLDEKYAQRTNTDFSPAVNTREGEFAYHIEVDLPGMKKEDITVNVEDKKLIISGERKHKEEIKEENYYKVESRYGTFSRSFTLPEDCDVESIHASSENGVLEVVIPKLETSDVDKVKTIEIK